MSNGTGNAILRNTAQSNGNDDLFSVPSDCSGTIWSANVFGTANVGCIS